MILLNLQALLMLIRHEGPIFNDLQLYQFGLKL